MPFTSLPNSNLLYSIIRVHGISLPIQFITTLPWKFGVSNVSVSNQTSFCFKSNKTVFQRPQLMIKVSIHRAYIYALISQSIPLFLVRQIVCVQTNLYIIQQIGSHLDIIFSGVTTPHILSKVYMLNGNVLIICHRWVGETVEFCKLYNVTSDLFIVGMKNVHTTLMSIDAIDIFVIDVTSNIGTLVYYQNRFSMSIRLMCKMAPFQNPLLKIVHIIIIPFFLSQPKSPKRPKIQMWSYSFSKQSDWHSNTEKLLPTPYFFLYNQSVVKSG